METYSNLGGDSGIARYKIADQYVDVQFFTGKIYTYSYSGPAGKFHVEEMKKLAVAGRGLNSYIKRNVNDKYDR